MIYYSIRLYIFISCLICFSFHNASAQELDGDTIFVNELGDISLKLPSKIVDRAINPAEATELYFQRSAYAGKGLRIGSNEADTKTATLTITEGERTHRFLLVYNKDVEFISGKFNRDYSTKDKLAERVKQMEKAKESAKNNNAVKPVEKPKEIEPANNSKTPEPVSPGNNDINHTAGTSSDRNKKYTDAMGLGLAYEDNKNYTRAKQEFERALQFKPGDLLAASKIKQLNKLIDEQNIKVENNKNAGLYKAYIDSARFSEAKNELSLAKMFYEKALTIKENDPVANARLTDIIKRIRMDDEYADAIDKARRLYNEGQLEESKIEYEKALKIYNRAEAKEQLNKINSLLKEQVAKEEKEKKAMLAEKSIAEKFEAQIQRADAEYDKNNYVLARRYYKEALITKPGDSHPKDRIAIIDNFFEVKKQQEQEKKDSIAAAKKMTTDFNTAKARGNAYEKQGDLENALKEYTKASELFPDDAAVAGKVQKMTIEIIKITETKKLDSLYQQYKDVGDSLIATANNDNYLDNYSKAEISFNAAHDIMTTEVYATEQIKYMRNDVEYRRKENSIKAHNDSVEMVNNNQRDFNELYRKGAEAKQNFKYAEAKDYFEKALKIYPDNKNAKQELKIIENQLTKKQNAALISSEKFNRQNDPIPYTSKELAEKDAETDFSKPPKNQLFADKIKNAKKAKAFITDILAKEPVSCNYARAYHITIACQGTFMEDGYMYFKFILQNGSGDDFDMGKVELTPLSSPAQIIKPAMLYPDKFPIVKSKNEVQLVYVCSQEYVPQNEKLVFEVFDRQMSMSIRTVLDPIKR